MFNKNIIKKTLQLSILWCLIFCSISRAMIQEIDTFAQAQEEIQKADDQTLVVFDIDGTLTDDFDAGRDVFYRIWRQEGLQGEDRVFIKEAKKTLSSYKAKKKEKGVEFDGGFCSVDDFIDSSSVLSNQIALIEPNEIINLIKNLQSRGVKVIALTATPAGTFGVIDCMRKQRFGALQNLGIDFSSSFTQEEIVLDTLKQGGGSYPMFYKGVICAGVNDKGVALGAFLDRVNVHPSRVLFFDDRKPHVENVGKEMDKRGILYQGYWYRAAEKLEKAKFGREMARVQLGRLVEHDEYLAPRLAENAVQVGRDIKEKSAIFGEIEE